MTVIERLYTLGLLGDFDLAARDRDRHAMMHLLRQAELSESDATGCIDAIITDPKKHGY